jgi:hypothetical protein
MMNDPGQSILPISGICPVKNGKTSPRERKRADRLSLLIGFIINIPRFIKYLA